MASDLVEINERLTHARELVTQLTADIASWAERAVKIRYDPARLAVYAVLPKTYRILGQQVAEVPAALKIQPGLIANELRACLDALACQLAIRNGKSTSGVYFPISKSEAIFNEDGLKKIRKLSQADQDKIVALRPFRSDNPGADDLFGLHEIDRTRKHLRLAASAAHGGIELGRGPAITFYPRAKGAVGVGLVIDGIEIERIEYDGDKCKFAELNVEAVFIENVPWQLMARAIPTIAFLEPIEFEGLPVDHVLSELVDIITGVVAQFE